MQFTIDIPDGSSELQELQDCVAENNATEAAKDIPGKQIDEQQYATNIINGWLTNRVMDMFAFYVRQQSVLDLENKLGKVKDIKGK